MVNDDAKVCRCQGWWEQEEYGRQPMDNLRLSFDAGDIRGSGTDIVGPFTLTGCLDERGAVAIVKQYIDRHRVDYLGQYDGEGTMSGEWRIGPLRGRWLITIRRMEIDQEATIVEITPQRA